jgi:hypothetical protein
MLGYSLILLVSQQILNNNNSNMSTVIDNFTVTEVNHAVSSGGSIPSTVLTLSPLSGYVITATDFSATIASPLQSVVFSQDGENVLMTIVFIAGFTITSDLSVPICISGESTEVTISLSVNYAETLSNATSSISPGLINKTGSYNSTTTVFTSNVTADADNYFLNEPTCNVTTGLISSYNITNTKTLNSNNLLTGISFTKVRSYAFNTSSFSSNGETRRFTVYGGFGAAWQLQVSDGTTTTTYSNTITSSGSDFYDVVIPPGLGSTYTFTLSGSLLSPFPQPLTWTIVQGSVIPTAIAATYQAQQSQSTTIQLNGSDPLNQPLTYIITSLPTGTSTLQTTGTTPTIINSGNIPFTLPTDSGGINNEVVFVAASSAGTNGFGFKVRNGTALVGNDSSVATATVDIVSGAPATINITASYIDLTSVVEPTMTLDVGASGPFKRTFSAITPKLTGAPGGGISRFDYEIIVQNTSSAVGIQPVSSNITPASISNITVGTVTLSWSIFLEVTDGSTVASTDVCNITMFVLGGT